MRTSRWFRIRFLSMAVMIALNATSCGGAHSESATTPAAGSVGVWTNIFVVGAESDLVATTAGVPYHVHVRTTQLREMSGAMVASLVWTQGPENGSQQAFLGPPSAVAVSRDGAVRLFFNQPDLEIARLISSSEAYGPIPDGAMSAVRSRGGSVTRTQDGGQSVLCFEASTVAPGQDCEDVCVARFCIVEGGSIRELSGNWAPNQGLFRAAP